MATADDQASDDQAVDNQAAGNQGRGASLANKRVGDLTVRELAAVAYAMLLANKSLSGVALQDLVDKSRWAIDRLLVEIEIELERTKSGSDS
ncbi:MAG TPA: hypothetical protein VG433_10075 [Pirellulales bacterium]|jgi:hypothetical protein|nr:hypothetical protein [Pirellulales bacterium]